MDSSELLRPDDYSTVAQELFKLLTPHRNNKDLEIEIRLCRLTLNEVDTTGVSNGEGIRIVKGKVECGVSEADYTRIAAYCETLGESVSRTATRDVVNGGCRYTYSADEKSPHCIAAVRKQRLLVREIAVPSAAYNLRFSVSIETSQPVPNPNAHMQKGYTRWKDRQSVVSGLYCYDATRVRASGVPSYEVEIEGVFTDPDVQLTECWVKGLLERAVAIARLPLKREDQGKN